MQNGKSIDASRMVSVNAKSTTGNATEFYHADKQQPPTLAGFPCRQAAKIATLRPFVQESRFPLPRQQIATGSVQSRLPAEEIRDSPAARQPLQQGNWAQSRRCWRNLGHLLSYLPHSSPLHRTYHRPLQQNALLMLCFPKKDKEGRAEKQPSNDVPDLHVKRLPLACRPASPRKGIP